MECAFFFCSTSPLPPLLLLQRVMPTQFFFSDFKLTFLSLDVQCAFFFVSFSFHRSIFSLFFSPLSFVFVRCAAESVYILFISSGSAFAQRTVGKIDQKKYEKRNVEVHIQRTDILQHSVFPICAQSSCVRRKKKARSLCQ